MNFKQTICGFALLLAIPNVWAYGSSSGGSGKKVCDQANFSEYSPPDQSTVSSGSEFSFKISPKIKPDSIKVHVKEQPIAISITPESMGSRVKGKLPDALKRTYARISIQAVGIDKCQGSSGWLVKIAE